jgi:hypothetical protein
VVIGLSVFIMTTFGSSLFLTPRGFSGPVVEKVDLSQTAWLLVVYGARVPPAVLLLMGVYMWKARRDLKLQMRQLTLLKLALFALCVLNLIVSNPINAPRLWVGGVGLAILFILLPWKGPRSYLLWATLSCLGLLLLFSGFDPRGVVAGPLNEGEQISLDSVLNSVSKAIPDLSTDPNFDAYAMFASTVRYADENGYRWGSQLLLPAFFWVPRSIWNNKPEGTPFFVARSLNLNNLSVGCPLWAEGYINFGVAGTLLFLLIFGRLAHAADDFLVHNAHQIGLPFPTIVSAFFASNTYILLRGDLTTGTMYLQLIIVASFLFVRFLQVKHP